MTLQYFTLYVTTIALQYITLYIFCFKIQKEMAVDSCCTCWWIIELLNYRIIKWLFTVESLRAETNVHWCVKGITSELWKLFPNVSKYWGFTVHLSDCPVLTSDVLIGWLKLCRQIATERLRDWNENTFLNDLTEFNEYLLSYSTWMLWWWQLDQNLTICRFSNSGILYKTEKQLSEECWTLVFLFHCFLDQIGMQACLWSSFPRD